MGTVPDPPRSAKLALVTASVGEDHLGDPASAQRQPRAPSNGFSCSPAASAGACPLELSCAAAAGTRRREPYCGDDARRQEAFPLGPGGGAAETRPAAVEPAGCSQPAGSRGAAAPAAAGAPVVGREPEMMPAPQSSRQFVQGSQATASSLAQVDDSALKPQGTDDQPALEPLNYPSPGGPIRSHESCSTSQANLRQRGENERGADGAASAACPSASPGRSTEAGPGRDPQTALEAKGVGAGTALLRPAGEAAAVPSSEPPAQPGHESRRPDCGADARLASPGPGQLSRFRETGTMTVQPESSCLAQEAASRTSRDAEVQAVATVESRSASTSPSILAAFLKGNPPPEEKEELHIIYQGAPCGLGSHGTLTGSVSPQQECPCSPGTASKSTGTAWSASPQPVALVPLVLSTGNEKPLLPASPATVGSPGAPGDEAEVTGPARGCKDPALPPRDAPVPPELVPGASDSGNESSAWFGSGEPSATSAGAGAEDNVQDLVREPGSCRLPSPCSTDREVRAKEVPGGSEQKPEPSEGASHGEARPVLRPKEKDSALLGSEGGLNVSGQSAAARATDCSEDAGEKESRSQGAVGQAQVATDRAQVASGRLMPELSACSACLTPPSEALAAPRQQGLQAKEPGRQLPTAAPPAPALPALGGSQAQPTPAMEARVQVKQSKHVRDVIWDEQGMTWEVYGASLDAESLGIAIQNHLQRQIREHERLIRAQNSQTRKSVSSDTSSSKKLKGRQHNVFQSLLQNFRRPNCCVRPAPSSVLD
ncbi:GRIN3 protein, partial [Rhinopomastus cyanomelas]|nr:GRIN3 protein [Rhinopomastus cyanomelas]